MRSPIAMVRLAKMLIDGSACAPTPSALAHC
jgi:hypothetical protein